jgi:hypothetical protein
MGMNFFSLNSSIFRKESLYDALFIPDTADAHQVLLNERYLLIVSWQLAGSMWFH